MNRLLLLLTTVLLFVSPSLLAEPGALSAVTVTTNSGGDQEYSVTLQVLAFMTALSFLPAMLILMTSFTRIVVVMSILRQAMGLQQTPSNQVINGIALFLTFFIMTPVFDKINEVALQPYLNEEMPIAQALEKGKKPMMEFMLAQTRLKDLETFLEIADVQVASPEEVPITVLIPAFVTSELKTAFQIGFMIFIPFLIIDLVV
ncbi:MAG: flagellar biosynthetic protein FliP, partial [Psychromonas sp.]|nr:flagellar biosynthetic protein FliP [Psychromonas sp.]